MPGVDFPQHFDSFITMEMNQAVVALSALAQESRLAVFRLLVACGSEGLPAGQIAEKLEIPSATLSFHLKELSNAGLAESRKEGRMVIYALSIKGINSLMEFLTEDCCQGRPELCAPGCCDTAQEKKPPNESPKQTLNQG